MILSTSTGVEEYLNGGSVYSNVTEVGDCILERVDRINGGITNYVYKLTFSRGIKCNFLGGASIPRTAILKYATEYTASDPPIKFPVQRQWFEAEALRILASVLYLTSEDAKVGIPGVLMYDQPNAILILEDIAPPCEIGETGVPSVKHFPLQNWLSDITSGQIPLNTAIDISRQIGTSLGVWLARLHGLALSKSETVLHNLERMRDCFGKNIPALDLTLQYTFGDVFVHLQKLGVVLSSETHDFLADIFDTLTQDARSANQPVIMGDFWAGNVIMSLEEANGGHRFRKAHVVDWEFVMSAPSYFDLAHFAAEIWMDERFGPNPKRSDPSPRRTLLSAMFASYRAAGLSIDMQKIIYYISGHVCCFSGYSPRSEDFELNSKVAHEVIGMAMHAKAENWEMLKHDDLIADLM